MRETTDDAPASKQRFLNAVNAKLVAQVKLRKLCPLQNCFQMPVHVAAFPTRTAGIQIVLVLYTSCPSLFCAVLYV